MAQIAGTYGLDDLRAAVTHAAKTGSEALHPVHRTVTANARRLKRR